MDDFQKNKEERVIEIVSRYESMLVAKVELYFDVDEFELIIGYYLEQGNNGKANSILDYAYSIFPNSEILVFLKCQTLLATGKVSEAIHKLKSIEYSDSNEDVHLLLASAYSQIKNHAKSIEHYLHVIPFVNESILEEVKFDLVFEYQAIDDFLEAIEVLKEILIANPENEAAVFEIAFCFDAKNLVNEGLTYFNSFIDNHPYSFITWFNLGNFYLKSDEIELAIEAFEFSYAIQEDFTPAMINLAMVYVLRGDNLKAIHVFNSALEYEPANDFIFSAIAESYEQIGNLIKAVEYYKEAIQINPKNVDALYGIAVVYRLIDEHRKAHTFIKRAFEIDGENEVVILVYAQVKIFYEEYEMALDLLNLVLGLNDEHYAARIELVMFHLETEGRFDKSITVLEEGLMLFDEDDSLYLLLMVRKISILHEYGKRKEALLELGRLVFNGNDIDVITDELRSYSPDIFLDMEIVKALS